MPLAHKTTRVSTKGQVILPVELRNRRGWGPGQVLELRETPDGLLLTEAPVFPRTQQGSAAGLLRPSDGRARSIEAMNQAIEDEVRARHERGRY